MKFLKISLMAAISFQLSISPAFSQKITIDKNKPERKAWFQDLAFGMFIHWNIDVTYGAVISHSLAASSRSYQEKYFENLPALFNPKDFNPAEWAKLARIAGMRYMVFTAKHHNGFCMWDTRTTEFKITKTPFGKDALKEIITAFRNENIAVGLYFSPDDFHVMYEQNLPLSRSTPESEPTRNSALWEIDKAQLKELLTEYGKIDILFIDENSDWANMLVANYAWQLDPDLIITRGGMPTPEKFIPDKPFNGPWEACMTIGRHWQYVGSDYDKDATKLIEQLVEIRAKGGNLLLNVGPDASGQIPESQKARLREIGLWMMSNGEAIYGSRPGEEYFLNDIWFTQSNDKKEIYAILNGRGWERMQTRSFLLSCIEGNNKTKATVLGQGNGPSEYNSQLLVAPKYAITNDGFFVSIIRAQRLNDTWDNPVVLRIDQAQFFKKSEKDKKK